VKVLSIVGNRPQFIKSAPLSLALRARGLDEVVVHTGQHYDRELSQVFYEELELDEPRYRLDLRTADVDAITAGVAGTVAQERPDWVLVYGDTNSTTAGARAAVAAGVPVAHVEAGLRSGDLEMPRSTASPLCCSARTSAPARRSRPKASRAARRSWAT
jgi:UDP-N-acetylglucosamine 2-epimerase